MKMKTTNNLISTPLPPPRHLEAYFVQAIDIYTWQVPPRGWVLCSPLAFVLHSVANTFYQYA